MSLEQLSKETAAAIHNAISDDLSEDERNKIAKILEDALIKSVNQTTKSHQAATVISCGPEADLAHKISENMNLASKALVANLSALR